MKVNSQLRKEARVALNRNWGTLVAVTFVLVLLVSMEKIANAFLDAKFLTVVWVVLILPLQWSYIVSFLPFIRQEGYDANRSLFLGYRGKHFWRVLGTMLLTCIYSLLWTLLLIIPGLVKLCSYAMVPYILLDEPERSCNEAIRKSVSMMEGYKMKLLIHFLSFAGWFLLCILTFGVGFLFLIPYFNTSMAAFYEDVKADYEARISRA